LSVRGTNGSNIHKLPFCAKRCQKLLENPSYFKGGFSILQRRNSLSIKNRVVNIVFWIAVLMADLIGYVFIGLLMMKYDDNYDVSKGTYGSWKSMTDFDRAVFASLYLWHTLNIFFLGWVLWKFYKFLMIKYSKNK